MSRQAGAAPGGPRTGGSTVTDQERLRSYVLGTLSEGEAEELERRLLVDEELHERLEMEQDALVEAHVRGTLSPADGAQLEARMRASPALAEHVRQERLLHQRLAPAAARARVRSYWPAAAAALLLVAAATWWWQARPAEAPDTAAGSPSPAPAPPSPAGPVSPAPPAAVEVVSLTLSPGQTMSGGSPDGVALAPGIQRVQLELVLDPPVAAAYAVVIRSERERLIWRDERAQPNSVDATLTLAIPARVLAPGRYRLELAPAGTIASDRTLYYFEVAR
jgi:hypothetical protein